MNTKRMILTGFVAAIAFSASACATPPKVLFSETTSGDRLVQHYAITAEQEGFYDYYVRVCDLGEAGELSQCNDTRVLEDVAIGLGGR